MFGRDNIKLREIMRYTKSRIEKAKPPAIEDVEAIRTAAAADRVRKLAEEGEGEKYLSVIHRIIRDADAEGVYLTPEDIAAALFRLAFSELEEKDYERMDFDDEEFEYSRLDMVRLFINAGRLDGLKEAHIVKGIASRSSLSGKMIGSIEMHRNFSFVDIPRAHVEEVMEAMQGFTHAGRGISFEVASKKKRGGSKGAKKPKASASRKRSGEQERPKKEISFRGKSSRSSRSRRGR